MSFFAFLLVGAHATTKTGRRGLRTFGGGGLPKKDHLKDWRKQQGTAAPNPFPTTSPSVTPTPFPTTSPSAAPTRSPTKFPTPISGDDCLLFGYQEIVQEYSNYLWIDLEPVDDEGAGDYYTFAQNDLFVDGERVGSAFGRCILLETADDVGMDYCIMEYIFPYGKVLLQGRLAELVVIGGNESCEDVNGKSESIVNEPELRLTFQKDDNACSDALPYLASPWFQEFGDTYTDWDSNEITPGDTFVADSKSIITDAGVQGTSEYECMVLIDPDTESKVFCVMTFRLGPNLENIMTVQGILDNMVITGGTGCFNGVSGIVRGSYDDDEETWRLDLNLDDETSNENEACSSDLFADAWIEQFSDDALIYYQEDAREGFAALFDNNIVTLSLTGETIGIVAGRCFVLDEFDDYTYCSVVFDLDEGSILVQGFFDSMIIVGATGCFRGLSGTVRGEENTENSAEYSWSVVYK